MLFFLLKLRYRALLQIKNRGRPRGRLWEKDTVRWAGTAKRVETLSSKFSWVWDCFGYTYIRPVGRVGNQRHSLVAGIGFPDVVSWSHCDNLSVSFGKSAGVLISLSPPSILGAFLRRLYWECKHLVGDGRLNPVINSGASCSSWIMGVDAGLVNSSCAVGQAWFENRILGAQPLDSDSRVQT